MIDNCQSNEKSSTEYLKNKYRNLELYKIDQANAGVARNVGLSKVKTKWVLFADSDDVFLPDLFDRIRPFLDIDSDVVYFPPEFKSDITRKRDYRQHYKKIIGKYIEKPSKRAEWRIRLTFDVPWSKLIKYKYIEDNNLRFEATKKQNDTIFSQKLGILAEKNTISSVPIYTAIDNSDSITHNLEKEYFKDAVSVKIRSYKLKMSCVDKKILKQSNDLLFYEPFQTIVKSFNIYRNPSFTYDIFLEFKKNGVPIVTPFVIRTGLRRILSGLKRVLKLEV